MQANFRELWASRKMLLILAELSPRFLVVRALRRLAPVGDIRTIVG
jgi:hypothetical protein